MNNEVGGDSVDPGSIPLGNVWGRGVGGKTLAAARDLKTPSTAEKKIPQTSPRQTSAHQACF